MDTMKGHESSTKDKLKAIPKGKAAMEKIRKTMGEWKAGELHSGSKTGPVVKNQKQAVAISLNQVRRGTR